MQFMRALTIVRLPIECRFPSGRVGFHLHLVPTYNPALDVVLGDQGRDSTEEASAEAGSA